MLDSTGFKRKTYDELFGEMEAEAQAKFGANVNTSALSPLGIILRLFAWFLSIVWMVLEAVYFSAYKNTAEGNNLDRLGPHIGITRTLEQAATGEITITGSPNYTVLEGFRISTETDIVFETLEPVTLNGSGQGTGPIRSLEPGPLGNVAAGTITVIVNPDANVMSVTNIAETSGGREKETDTEFRERWDLSVAGGGAATVDSIRSALLRVPGVRAARVIENTAMTADVSGRPAKSFEAFVLGGAAADIGKTILETKAAGIETYGSQSVTVKDLAGYDHVLKFSFATEINIYVRVTITKNASYPADGDKQVESAIVSYIGGEDADGQIYVGLSMGDDVIFTRLIAVIYKVVGIEDIDLELSIDGTTWTQDNVAVAPQGVAQTSHSLITVVMAS